MSEYTGNAKKIKVVEPRILYVIGSICQPAFATDFYRRCVEVGEVDSVVIQTAMSGAVPTRHPYSLWPFINASVKRVPTFMLPDAPHAQMFYPRYDWDSFGVVPLETAFSANVGDVIINLGGLLRKNSDKDAIKWEMRNLYKKR